MEFRPFVYGLVDPLEPKHVRYVGMASKNKSRPYQHAKKIKSNVNPSHFVNWLRKLADEGRSYDVLILQELPAASPRSFVGFVERCYIDSLRKIGHDLTNVSEGGWGGDTGRLQSPEERKKMSEFQTGRTRSVETREKMAEAKRNRVVTEEAKKNLSAALSGRKLSEEHCAKISEALKKRVRGEDTRAKLKNAWTDERRLAARNRMLGNTRTLGMTFPKVKE